MDEWRKFQCRGLVLGKEVSRRRLGEREGVAAPERATELNCRRVKCFVASRSGRRKIISCIICMH